MIRVTTGTSRRKQSCCQCSVYHFAHHFAPSRMGDVEAPSILCSGRATRHADLAFGGIASVPLGRQKRGSGNILGGQWDGAQVMRHCDGVAVIAPVISVNGMAPSSFTRCAPGAPAGYVCDVCGCSAMQGVQPQAQLPSEREPSSMTVGGERVLPAAAI
ncbi:hypothetical protein BC834DRAFT_107870 [Gloeopeniophorella convolvens]|nr:hypothetical protein BC834DRAFT_107870 [Gloeopeniophorella convolvens]